MDAYAIGRLGGTLLITFLLTRIARKFTGKDVQGSILGVLVVLVLMLVLLVLSNGRDDFWQAAWTNLVAAAVWLVVDLGSVKRRAKAG
jgi:hypothetical protein